MQIRLLDFLLCPDCRTSLNLIKFAAVEDEIDSGVLYCGHGHFFPIASGIPRMLPSSFADYWPEIDETAPQPLPDPLKEYVKSSGAKEKPRNYDVRTKANFSNEWDNHEIGGRTWTMVLNDRVRWFFLESIGISKQDLAGKVMLDAGCGNGSQSVAYTEFELEVLAVDLSTGLEKGHAYRNIHLNAKPENVHFIQADLQNPPFKEKIVDIIHSAGVLHHTPNTESTFRTLTQLLKDDGTFYVWVYKYEKIVTPIVNSMRAVTTRLPSSVFKLVAKIGSVPFTGFCWAVNRLGIRQYETPSIRESVLALHDIFGAPYAHYHSFDEISGWFGSVGITNVWPCNESRRGFGVCGRKSSISG